jgi:serine/threonine protein kinase
MHALYAEQGNVKLIDFGMALPLVNNKVAMQGCSPSYVAAESYTSVHIGPAADFYSLGTLTILQPSGIVVTVDSNIEVHRIQCHTGSAATACTARICCRNSTAATAASVQWCWCALRLLSESLLVLYCTLWSYLSNTASANMLTVHASSLHTS